MSRRENLRNGFQRLSIVTGILGAVIGVAFGADDFSRGNPMPMVIGFLAGGFIGWGAAFGSLWVALGFLGDGLKKPQREDEVA